MDLDIDKSLKEVELLFKNMDFNPQEPSQEEYYDEAPKPKVDSNPKIVRAADTVRNVLGDNFFNIEFDGNKIEVTEKGSINADEEYPNLIASLIEYMLEQGLNIVPLPDIRLVKDPEQSRSFFGKTAYYNPQTCEIALYVLGRHKKDVVRSFSHEMIHHMQNLEGRLSNIGTTNTNEDSNLQEIEKEAYLMGNITFRNWEDKIKNGK